LFSEWLHAANVRILRFSVRILRFDVRILRSYPQAAHPYCENFTAIIG
jgi:hypothetical protein